MTVRCEWCGKFVPYAEMDEGGGAQFRFVPDNHFGPEESEWTCKACVIKQREHDAKYSMHNVR